jgi:hypothetical protein
MRFLPVPVAAGLFLYVGMIAPVCAGDDKQKSKKQAKSNKPAKPVKQEKAGQSPPKRSEVEAKAWQQQRGWNKQGGGWQGQETWQLTRAQRWSSDHRTWTQRGGYGGFYIPQETFALHFGNQNLFRITSRPSIYMRYPRFEHGGYAFLMLDPWPEYWAENWYDVNEVYVDYDDGYYLHNRSYPQVRLAITIAL